VLTERENPKLKELERAWVEGREHGLANFDASIFRSGATGTLKGWGKILIVVAKEGSWGLR